MDDGVALISAAHPRLSWWRRLWFWLCRPQLSPESLETVEIEIRESDVILSPQQARLVLNHVFPGSKRVNDREIEQEIKAKGLTAPRVTLELIESTIAWEYYATGAEAFTSMSVAGPAWKAHQNSDITPLACLTLCVLMLQNGFMVTGESCCASPENFDEALGRKIARQHAIDKVWALEGYLLKERLYRDSINRSSDGGDFGDS